MGINDFSCNTGASLVGHDGYGDNLRVYCYWKNNGWRYHMSPVYGWVSCNGEERCVYDAGYPDFTSDNQAQYELGYSDYWLGRGTNSYSVEYHARLRSDSTYASGERTSGSGYHTVGALASHTVSYNANGGSGAPGSQTKWYGSILTLSSTQPTRTGYTFQGWATSSSGGVAYSPGGQYGADSDITLYAVWKANTWTVSYNANGGSGAPSNQTKTYGQTLTLSSTKPTRTDYNFKSWNTAANGSGTSYSPGGSFTSNANTTLYAQWELAYVKPRLSNVRIARCDTSGNWSDSGTKIRVDFDYATDLTGVYAKLQYKSSSASSWTDASSAILSNSSTKSGSISKKNFSETFSIETSYSARIMIYDSKGTSYATYSGEVNIPTQKYPIDVKSGGTGVAFGKVAERNDTLDIGYNNIYFKNNPLFLAIYPIGSIFETTDENFNPNSTFGGTWTCIFDDYEKIHMGSHRIFEDWLNESGPVTKTYKIGAYDYNLFVGIFEKNSQFTKYKNLPGYDAKIGITAQVSTGRK